MRYFLEFSYNGKNFHGWQIQPNSISVQEVLNNSISKILREKIKVTGAGRTDAGVHANQMFCHFNTEILLDEKFILKLNNFLPKDIFIKDVFRVKDDLNSRFDAQSREYKYFIIKEKNPFFYETSHYFRNELDLELMNEACVILKKSKNFKCFTKSNTQVDNYMCNITYAKWKKEGDFIIFTIRANRFLRNMVRAIVGTMLDLGIKKIDLENFKEIIELGDRNKAGYSVPPQGLFLNKISYKKNIYIL